MRYKVNQPISSNFASEAEFPLNVENDYEQCEYTR
jgi:hypothetical protein